MRLALALALALSLSQARAAGSGAVPVKEKIQGARQDLKEVQRDLKKKKTVLKNTVKQEKSLLGQLEQLNRKLEAARRESLTHVKNLGLVEDRLTRIRSRLEQLDQEEQEDRSSLKASLVALYKARSRRGPALLFSVRTPAELSARTRYLGALSQGTDRRFRSLQARIEMVRGFKDEFASRQVELTKQRAEVEQSRRRVEQERLHRQSLLKNVRSKKAKTSEAVKELERSFGELQGLLGRLQEEAQRLARQRAANSHDAAPTTGGPTTLRRGLAWPVHGRVVSEYGKHRHPVFHTLVFNRGIEIAAPYGSPIHAVAAGTVLHASPMEGFGELVVLDHGGSMMSVYAYASKIHVSVGQGVAQGDLLADVGEAGASKSPSLYFEIRKGAKALNPFLYLKRR